MTGLAGTGVLLLRKQLHISFSTSELKTTAMHSCAGALSNEGDDAFPAAGVKMILKEGNVLREVEAQQSF